PIIDENIKPLFELLVDIIQTVKRKVLLDFKEYNIIYNFLDELIEALVSEIYFVQDFKEKNIEIAKHTKELFKPLEGLTEEDQLATIEEVYNKYREKSNPLRNQIKLMKIELSELLLPILSV